ncbi:hypothetical protein T08_12940 [Trichinella sp. T8]|nr:hypothetical protein T08_12940 [Trichinella sp. T8]
MKTVPQIYHEEASSASADFETADQFPTYKSVKTVMYRKLAGGFQDFRQLAKENLSILSDHSAWSMDGTFKIVSEWYQQIVHHPCFYCGRQR